MAEFPSLPLWTDAYMADTTHLTTLEHGAYFLLLVVAWRSKDVRLPDDDKLLARYTRLTPAQWKRIKPVISQFFTIENGYWMQGRLTDEFNAVKQYRKRQSDAGKASALKRKGRHSTAVESGCNHGASPTPTPSPNILPPNGGCALSDAPEDDFTFVDFEESWAEVAKACGLPVMRDGARDRRRKDFNTRKRQFPDIDDWRAAFSTLRKAKWMHGDNSRQWRCDADDFLNPKKFTRLVEGKYGQTD